MPPGPRGEEGSRECVNAQPSSFGLWPQSFHFASVQHLVLDFFSGMGGLLQAMLDSGIEKLLGSKVYHLFFEVDNRCRRLLVHHHTRRGVWLSNMADSRGIIGSPLVLLEQFDSFISFLAQFPSLRSLLLAQNSPCVREAGADTHLHNLCMLPFLLPRLKAALPHVHIVFMLEGDSEPGRHAAISATLQVQPHPIRASFVLPAEQDRCYWTNLQVSPLQATSVDAASVLEHGWRPLWEFPTGKVAVDMRFASLCQSSPESCAREMDSERACFPRLPLHCYSRRGLVYKTNLSVEEKTTLEDKVRSCLGSGHGGQSLSRLELARWIHAGAGGRVVRPLSGTERDKSLGFPAGASALPGDLAVTFCLERMQVTGSSVAVPVAQQTSWLAWVIGGRPLQLHHKFPEFQSMEGVLESLTTPCLENGLSCSLVRLNTHPVQRLRWKARRAATTQCSMFRFQHPRQPIR